MQLIGEDGVMAQADARAFAILMATDRTARRLRAADRTIAGAINRVATMRRRREAGAERAYAIADRALQRELAESIAPGWGRTFRVKMQSPPFRPASDRKISRSKMAPSAARPLRRYRTPLIDARGRVALYMNVTYKGFNSKGWRSGLAAAHVEYIFRDGSLEEGDVQLVHPISNMGESVEEIEAAWRMLEAVEEGYRANAKVQYRVVLNLPHELSAGQRRSFVYEFCERTFGRLGLPYAAALHVPDELSDQRNVHAHIVFSTRPCERTASYQWDVAEEKVNGLTNKAGLFRLRALCAAHMNQACRHAGLATRFTHLSYQARGLNAQRQERVGPERMAAFDRGETVAVIENNAHIVTLNELSVATDSTAKKLVLAERETALLARSVEIAARRRNLDAQRDTLAKLTRRIRAVTIPSRRRPLPDVAIVREIASRAASVRKAIQARVARNVPMGRSANVRSIAATVRRMIAQRILLEARRTGVDQAVTQLGAIRQRLDQNRLATTTATTTATATAAAANEVGRSVLLGAKVAPYQTGKLGLELDISRLDGAEAARVQAMDEHARRAALSERHRNDRRTAADLKAAAEEGKRQHQVAWQNLLEELRTKRRHIATKDGKPVWDPSMLGHHGLKPAANPPTELAHDVQEILQRQHAEISQIAEFSKTAPGSIRNVDGKWSAPEHAPADIKRLVQAWSDEPRMQSVWGREAQSVGARAYVAGTSRLADPSPSIPDGRQTAPVTTARDAEVPAAGDLPASAAGRRPAASEMPGTRYEEMLVAAAEARQRRDARWRKTRRIDTHVEMSVTPESIRKVLEERPPHVGNRPFPKGPGLGH
ncbi:MULTISPECIES: MobA/MobL family protein [unclassified Sphingopyxis]|uniref:MobA/MobL family protein n=1 Tax=unclassified Sphingopyxis TaxID=2614943 RepID=UPI0025E49B85|nr:MULTISPECIES: MobA/MobL family protein [unclassified Sphingopyxis]